MFFPVYLGSQESTIIQSGFFDINYFSLYKNIISAGEKCLNRVHQKDSPFLRQPQKDSGVGYL